MQDDRTGAREDGTAPETREQRGGEGASTRFGMEDSDPTETPATGGPIADEEEDG